MSSGVDFEEDSFGKAKPSATPSFSGSPNFVHTSFSAPSSDQSGMAGWLMRHGFANSEKVAQGILISIVVINVIITIVVIKFIL